ncbi:hypothetical protein [Owenweeksia hongkongensis]|uniref:hypothetical protein n=1 Tax=Owenweeksia hongkongensis TaxID=253245 RepID=UPI003A95C0C6
MSFGNNRTVSSRKPKKPYAYLKQLYGEQLEKHLNTTSILSTADRKFTAAEWKKFRREVKEKAKEEDRQKVLRMLLSMVLTIAALFLIVVFFRTWFDF